MTESQLINDERLPFEISVTVSRGLASEARDLELSLFDRVVIPVQIEIPRASQPLRSAGLRTQDGPPVALVEDEELAGPAVEAARKLYRELQVEYAELDQLDAEMGFEDLSRSQRVAISKSENIIRDHALQKDFTGVAKERNSLLPGDGHIEEMRNALAGLERPINSLKGSLNNPNLDAETKTTLGILSRPSRVDGPRLQRGTMDESWRECCLPSILQSYEGFSGRRPSKEWHRPNEPH